jgi:hypothetical protein
MLWSGGAVERLMYAVLGNEFVRSITQVFGPFLKTDYYYIVVRGRYFLFRNYWKVISVVIHIYGIP